MSLLYYIIQKKRGYTKNINYCRPIFQCKVFAAIQLLSRSVQPYAFCWNFSMFLWILDSFYQITAESRFYKTDKETKKHLIIKRHSETSKRIQPQKGTTLVRYLLVWLVSCLIDQFSFDKYTKPGIEHRNPQNLSYFCADVSLLSESWYQLLLQQYYWQKERNLLKYVSIKGIQQLLVLPLNIGFYQINIDFSQHLQIDYKNIMAYLTKKQPLTHQAHAYSRRVKNSSKMQANTPQAAANKQTAHPEKQNNRQNKSGKAKISRKSFQSRASRTIVLQYLGEIHSLRKQYEENKYFRYRVISRRYLRKLSEHRGKQREDRERRKISWDDQIQILVFDKEESPQSLDSRNTFKEHFEIQSL